jgi:hypothetical protein
MRALRALKRSPLALDLYALISYRAFVIVQKNLPPQFISWEQLSRQLGTDYANLKDFKKEANAALRKNAAVYADRSGKRSTPRSSIDRTTSFARAQIL